MSSEVFDPIINQGEEYSLTINEILDDLDHNRLFRKHMNGDKAARDTYTFVHLILKYIFSRVPLLELSTLLVNVQLASAGKSYQNDVRNPPLVRNLGMHMSQFYGGEAGTAGQAMTRYMGMHGMATTHDAILAAYIRHANEQGSSDDARVFAWVEEITAEMGGNRARTKVLSAVAAMLRQDVEIVRTSLAKPFKQGRLLNVFVQMIGGGNDAVLALLPLQGIDWP